MGSHFWEYVHCCARFKAAGGQFISATVPRIRSSANRVEMKAWLRLCASETKDLICVILQKQQDMTCMFLFKQRRTASLEIPVQTQMYCILISVFSDSEAVAMLLLQILERCPGPDALIFQLLRCILHWWAVTTTNRQLMLHTGATLEGNVDFTAEPWPERRSQFAY